jgi:hypothetical protein
VVEVICCWREATAVGEQKKMTEAYRIDTSNTPMGETLDTSMVETLASDT